MESCQVSLTAFKLGFDLLELLLHKNGFSAGLLATVHKLDLLDLRACMLPPKLLQLVF